MSKRILLAACKYRLRDNMRGLLLMCGIYALVMLLLALTFVSISINGEGNVSSFGGSDMAFLITLFVFGIVSIRPDLAFFTLFGASRKTTFIALLVTAALTAFIAAIMNLLLLLLMGALSASFFHGSSMFISAFDFMFNQGARNFASALTEIGLATLAFFLVVSIGAATSLIYYRLGKWGKTLLSVIGGALLIIGLPIGAAIPALQPLYRAVGELIVFALSSPVASAICMLPPLVLAQAGSWLLLRRAALK